MDQNQTLKNMLAEDLPQGFVRTVITQADIAYREAFAVVQSCQQGMKMGFGGGAL